MTKTDIIAAVVEKTDLKKKDAEAAVNAALAALIEGLTKGEKAQIAGFGSFEVKERAAREGRNPLPAKPSKLPHPSMSLSLPLRL